MLTEERIKQIQKLFEDSADEWFFKDKESMQDYYTQGYHTGVSVILKVVLGILEDHYKK